MSDQMKLFLKIIEFWVGALFIVFVFPLDMPAITALAILLFVLSGILAIMFLFIFATFGENRHEHLIAIALIALLGFLSLGRGLRTGAQVHLLTNQFRYERILKNISGAKNDREREKACGEDCMLMSTEPLRVSFHYCHFFLNWYDIVYDPTGDIANPDIDSRHRLNTYLMEAENLNGHWYLANFGD